MSNPLSNKSVTILFKAAKRWFQLVRIKAHFMRQREQRFARYHKLPWFINAPSVIYAEQIDDLLDFVTQRGNI
jgi:hypothetical protein